MSWETNRRESVITRAGAEVDQGLRQYMLQVYNYMTIGLLITGFVSYLFGNTTLGSLFFYQDGRPNLLGWVAVLSPLFLTFLIGSAVSLGNASKALVLFVIFSALMGISLSTIFSAYTKLSIMRVFLISAGTFAAMSLYGYTTKRNLTSFGAFLTMGLFGIIIAMIVNIFLQSPALYFAVSIIGVFVFVGLTAYDTWKIRQMYNSNDASNQLASKAIFGALSLYLDFINLFLMLLRFFGDRRN